MLKSNHKIRITVVVDKELYAWIKEKAEAENRSISNFIETLLYHKKDGERITCISRQ